MLTMQTHSGDLEEYMVHSIQNGKLKLEESGDCSVGIFIYLNVTVSVVENTLSYEIVVK